MNIEKTVFFIWVFWHFYMYGPPPIMNVIITKLYFYLDQINNTIDKWMNMDYWDVYSDSKSETAKEEDKEDKDKNVIVEIKYEDKYLNIIRQLNKEWQLTEDELTNKHKLYEEFYAETIAEIKEHIEQLYQQINKIQEEIDNDTNIIQYIEAYDEEGDEIVEESTFESRTNDRINQIKELNETITILKNSLNNDNLLQTEQEQRAFQTIIKKRLDKLKHNYVIEKTPLGNVLMLYDNERESFTYYSDSNVPYRYLEVVARKYVKMFNCRPLYIDMEEELKIVDEKWTKDYEMKKAKEAEEKLKAEEAVKLNKPIEQKKNVFAKFKHYNKDAGGKISMATAPKNSIPNKNMTETKENEKILLKERANRYTYEGKFANFNFLQKIERKVFNKKLGLTFADFKKMNNKF